MFQLLLVVSIDLQILLNHRKLISEILRSQFLLHFFYSNFVKLVNRDADINHFPGAPHNSASAARIFLLFIRSS